MDRSEIQERATELLLEHLDHRQRQDYRRSAAFTVIGPETGRRYRLRYGELVKAMDTFNHYGEAVQYCLLMVGNMVGNGYGYPEPDRLLALKLLIETDEEHMLEIAG